MMTVRTNVAGRNNALDGFVDSLDTAGTLKFYSGTQPASAADAATGTLLATISLPNPAFGSAAAGSVAKSGTWSATVGTGGTAGWARLANAGDTVRQDYSVGSGSGDIDFDVVVWEAGGTVTVDTATISQAEA